jgi:protein-S-isoprenylcysteine O-methyltransferase Ste14
MSIADRTAKWLEWPVALLALLIVPALVLEERAGDSGLRQAAHVTNWIIWVACVLEFAVRWTAARSWRFLRTAWFDLLLIVISPPFVSIPRQSRGH